MSRPRVALATVAAIVLAGLAVSGPARAVPSTVVSLAFDDGLASQLAALPVLSAHGMTGTFYVSSGLLGKGSGYYMTWDQLKAVAAAGHEIGGHTRLHSDLTALPLEQAAGAVCDDRAELERHGLHPVSFAYPFAVADTRAEDIVRTCGYLSGRTVGGTAAVALPLATPYLVQTPAPASATGGLAALEAEVTAAQATGGWVVLVFHGLCTTTCSGASTTKVSTLKAFLDWLQARGTPVQRVGDVVGGTAPAPNAAPTTTATCDGAPCPSGWRRTATTVALAATDPEGRPWLTYLTDDGSDPRTSVARWQYQAPYPVTRTTTLRFYSRDQDYRGERPRTLTVLIDGARPAAWLTAPAPYARLHRGSVITLTARATDAGTGGARPSGIAKVVFRDGSTVLGKDTTPVAGTARYTLRWTVRGSTGTHRLTAVGYDRAGNVRTSTVVPVTIGS